MVRPKLRWSWRGGRPRVVVAIEWAEVELVAAQGGQGRAPGHRRHECSSRPSVLWSRPHPYSPRRQLAPTYMVVIVKLQVRRGSTRRPQSLFSSPFVASLPAPLWRCPPASRPAFQNLIVTKNSDPRDLVEFHKIQ
jgi:hypothetical protein